MMLGWLLLAATSAHAGLQVSPTSFEFKDEKSQNLWITNSGDAPASVQGQVFQWSQQNHTDILTKTGDFIINPSIVTIEPGQKQLVRVINTQKEKTPHQNTYRIVVSELPTNRPSPQQTGNNIRFLIQYSMPLFSNRVGDDNKSPQDFAFNARLVKENGKTWLTIKNNDPRVLKLSELGVVRNNQTRSLIEGLVGYVLPQSEMRWAVQNIAENDTLSVTINGHHEKTTFNISP